MDRQQSQSESPKKASPQQSSQEITREHPESSPAPSKTSHERKATKPHGLQEREANEERNAYQQFRHQVYLALERPLKAKPLGRIIGVGLILLIAANAVLVGTVGMDLPPDITFALTAFTHFSTISFAVEYCCRLWIADMIYPHQTKARARLHYALSPLGIIDFLAFAPMIVMWYVPLSGGIIAAIRILRMMRLVKISRYMKGLRSIVRVAERRHREIVAAFMAIMLLCVAASVLMYEAEHNAQPDKFNNVFTGLYWAITTVTGTGYGDLVPITPWGRFLGCVTMLLSVALAAIPAGIFSSGFIVEFRHADRESESRRNKAKSNDQQTLKDAIDANDVEAAVGALYRLLYDDETPKERREEKHDPKDFADSVKAARAHESQAEEGPEKKS